MFLILGTPINLLQELRENGAILALEKFDDKKMEEIYITFSGKNKEDYVKSEFPDKTESIKMLRGFEKKLKSNKIIKVNKRNIKYMLEEKSNNTAQNIVCTNQLWKNNNMLISKVYIITNKFHTKRTKLIIDKLKNYKIIPWEYEIISAEDPYNVQWREALENDILINNVESDISTVLENNCHNYYQNKNIY